MRFRLRTLLIVLGVAPPLLALAWFFRQGLLSALSVAITSAALLPFFGLWYWMLRTSQANPIMRGEPNYKGPTWLS
jgi:hypothetical protein